MGARRIFGSLGNDAEVPRLHAGVPLGPPSLQGLLLRLCQRNQLISSNLQGHRSGHTSPHNLERGSLYHSLLCPNKDSQLGHVPPCPRAHTGSRTFSSHEDTQAQPGAGLELAEAITG